MFVVPRVESLFLNTYTCLASTIHFQCLHCSLVTCVHERRLNLICLHAVFTFHAARYQYELSIQIDG